MSRNAGDVKDLHVDIRRIVPAPPEQVFKAWTDAKILKRWWGPEGVECIAVEIDLHPGGQYRIGNRLPDNSVLWISGSFEIIEPPRLLVYSWIVETEEPSEERVTVRFDNHIEGTELNLTHESITSVAKRDDHLHGWQGCLAGLMALFGSLSERCGC